MINGFVIFERGACPNFYLAQTDDAVTALEEYVRVEFGYTRQQDGVFRRPEVQHVSLQEALEENNIVESLGAYEDRHDGRRYSLSEVLHEFGIQQRTDSLFTCAGKTHSSAEKVLAYERRIQDHLEICPVAIDERKKWQDLFYADSEWTYVVATNYDEIGDQHWWQARRYAALEDIPNAIIEMKRCLKLKKGYNRVSPSFDLAGYQRKVGLLKQAADTYRKALRHCALPEGCEELHLYLAEVLEESGKINAALYHYKIAVKIEPLTVEDLSEKIREKLGY